MTLGNITAFPRSQFETLAGSTQSSGRLRCVRCDSTFTFISTRTYSTLTREPPPPPAPPPPAPLPALPAFAEEIARVVGGTVIALGLGTSPATSVRIGAHCVLLIRERDGGFALSLPLAGSWLVSSRADLAAAQAEITSALRAHPEVVSLSDVIAYLSRIWVVDRFSDRPVPREAWLRRGEQVIQLSQKADSVTITVSTHQRDVAKLSALEGLAPWIDEKLGDPQGLIS
jgi:hypothetical protein